MESFRPSFPARVIRVYSAHALASFGTNLLMPAFFFYSTEIFGWSVRRNLLLASGEGLAYMIGALMAHNVAHLFGRRNGAVFIQSLAGMIAAIAWMHPTPRLVVCAVLAYVMVTSSCWPIFESLISGGVGADLLSRRIGAYNLVWSSVGAVTMAISGTIIHNFPWGLFFLPVAAHALSIVLLTIANVEPPPGGAAHHDPEPALRKQRKLAMLISRISLPAMYVVVYTLMAMMPALPTIRAMGPSMQTVVASVWSASRTGAFLVLGATVWWHTRPKLLLIAAGVMLISFLGVTLRPADLLGHPQSPATGMDIALMIGWQFWLGIAMGLIYAGSLYFGMVLSDGATNQGGYHEALIGLGQLLGTSSAAAAQTWYPQGNLAAVGAVAVLLILSLSAALALTARSRK